MINRYRAKAVLNVHGEFVKYDDHLAAMKKLEDAHRAVVKSLKAEFNEKLQLLASSKSIEPAPEPPCHGCHFLRSRRRVYEQHASPFCILRKMYDPTPFDLEGISCRVDPAAAETAVHPSDPQQPCSWEDRR